MRDKAVESIRSVSESLPGSDVEKHFVPMINRLASGECYNVISLILVCMYNGDQVSNIIINCVCIHWCLSI